MKVYVITRDAVWYINSEECGESTELIAVCASVESAKKYIDDHVVDILADNLYTELTEEDTVEIEFKQLEDGTLFAGIVNDEGYVGLRYKEMEVLE